MPELRWQANSGPQTNFLASTAREVLYGGAVFSGKSEAICVMPLRWADHPQHRALIMRRTRPQLQEVIDRTLQLYPDIVPGAVWREAESRWKFPSGAVVQMGFADNEKDIFNFKSFQYNLICFDELTSFTEQMYRFMTYRNRTTAPDLPLMIRSGTNPGDVGHEWVYRTFIDKKEPYKIYENAVEFQGKRLVTTQQFIPAFAWDNPAAPEDQRDAYIAAILTRSSQEDIQAYLYGEWNRLAGAMFQQLKVSQTAELVDKDYFVVRCIDFGISDPTCVLWLVHYPRSGLTEVVSELYLKDPSIDDVANQIKMREAIMGLRPPIYSVGSPEMFNRQATSGQSISTMLGVLGIYLESGNRDRLAGWARLRTLQSRGALRVWPVDQHWGAPNLARTLPMLQRNTGLGKDPNELHPRQEDHAADALRYGIMVIFERPEVIKKVDPEPENPNKDYVFDKMIKDLRKGNRGTDFPQLGHWEA